MAPCHNNHLLLLKADTITVANLAPPKPAICLDLMLRSDGKLEELRLLASLEAPIENASGISRALQKMGALDRDCSLLKDIR